MKKKKRKHIIKHRDKIWKQQSIKTSPETKITEEDGGIFDESLKRLRHKITRITGTERDVIFRNNYIEKMSDILLEYGEPFLETIDTSNKAEYENAIMTTMMLWNYAIIREDPESSEETKEMLKPATPDAESRSFVNYMLDRKRQMFPDNKRLMLHYDLSEVPEGFHLSIASTPQES